MNGLTNRRETLADALDAWTAAMRVLGRTQRTIWHRRGVVLRAERVAGDPRRWRPEDVRQHVAALGWDGTAGGASNLRALRSFLLWCEQTGRIEASPIPAPRSRPGPPSCEVMDAWESAVVAWRVELLAAGRPATSLRMVLHYVRDFARTVERPELATRGDLLAYLGRPSWSPETRKSARTALRGFFAWAAEEGLIPADPAERLPKVRVPQAEPRPADDAAIEAALAAASDRVRLMLLLGAVSGLRRGEIARVHSDDLTGVSLLVHGKGGKTRTVDLPPGLVGMLRALPPGWAFPGQHGHMTPDSVGTLITRALPKGVTPHMLRHAAATALHEDGASLLELRVFLGHSSVAVTQRYVRVRQTRVTAAMGRRMDALGGAR